MDTDAVLQWAAMGRHGLYVWLAYGSALLVLGGLVLHARLDARRLRAELELEARMRAMESS